MRPAFKLVRRASRQVGHQIKHAMKRQHLQLLASKMPGAQLIDGVWMTPIEARLYRALRQRGLKPHAQYPARGYLLDFAFPRYHLAVEADGRASHDAARDHIRDGRLAEDGWTVLRFSGAQITHHTDLCVDEVYRHLPRSVASIKPALMRGTKLVMHHGIVPVLKLLGAILLALAITVAFYILMV